MTQHAAYEFAHTQDIVCICELLWPPDLGSVSERSQGGSLGHGTGVVGLLDIPVISPAAWTCRNGTPSRCQRRAGDEGDPLATVASHEGDVH